MRQNKLHSLHLKQSIRPRHPSSGMPASQNELPRLGPYQPVTEYLRKIPGGGSLLLLATIAGFFTLSGTHALAAEKTESAQTPATCCAVVELRQYTLHPGQRDVLIDLFNRKFIEPQEAVGISLIGQFRDLNDANRFVWLRGFADMPTRAEALKAFYYGPLWKANRDAANATIIDNDNVLLLRPARAGSGFATPATHRPAPDNIDIPKGFVVANLYYFDAPANDDFLDFFEHTLKPLFTDNGASVLGHFVSEHSTNTFPALPVRENENVFVWFSLFADEAAYERHVATLEKSAHWRNGIAAALQQRLKKAPEVLKLMPTARSQIHG